MHATAASPSRLLQMFRQSSYDSGSAPAPSPSPCSCRTHRRRSSSESPPPAARRDGAIIAKDSPRVDEQASGARQRATAPSYGGSPCVSLLIATESAPPTCVARPTLSRTAWCATPITTPARGARHGASSKAALPRNAPIVQAPAGPPGGRDRVGPRRAWGPRPGTSRGNREVPASCTRHPA